METKKQTKKQIAEQEKQEAIEMLRKLAPPGSTIYGIVRKVSASGMSRTIDFYAVGEDRQPDYLTGYFARVLGWTRTNRGLRVNGCGMDMIFHTVYEAAGVVWHGTSEYEAWKASTQKRSKTAPTATGYVWRSEQL